MNIDILRSAKLRYRSDDELVELTDYNVDNAFFAVNLLCDIPHYTLFTIPNDIDDLNPLECQYGPSHRLQTVLDEMIDFASSMDDDAADGDDETVQSQSTQPSQASNTRHTQPQKQSQQLTHSLSQSRVHSQKKSQTTRNALTPVSIAALGSRTVNNSSSRASRAEWEERVIAKSTYANLNTSMFPTLDAFVLSCVCVGGVQGRLNGWTLYHSTSMSSSGIAAFNTTDSGSKLDENASCENSTHSGINKVGDTQETRQYKIRYQIANNKFCGNVGRAHKSNGIMIDIDLNRGLAYQLCWDPDCRGYRSAPLSIPPSFRPDVSAIREYHSDIEILKFIETNPVLFG